MSLMRNSLLGLLILAQVFVWTACDSDESKGSAPGISITSPEDGTTIRLSTPIIAEVVSEQEISHVVFYIDGSVIDTVFTPPYETMLGASFNNLSNNSHALTAAAVTVSESSGTSEAVSVTIFSDNIAPTVQLTAPQENELLSAFTQIQVLAEDNDEIQFVKFKIDGELVGQVYTAPFSFNWNILDWADDLEHKIQVQAVDMSGNVSESHSYFVTVAASADIYPTLVSPSGGISIDDNVSIDFIWRVFPNANHSYVYPNGLDYTFEISTSPSFSPLLASTTIFDTSYAVSISANDEYYWRVKATENGTESDWSPASTFEIIGRPEFPELAEPADGTVFDNTNSVSFEWESTLNSELYEIVIASTEDFSAVYLTEELADNSISYSDFPKGNYFWRIRGKNSLGFYGDYSDVFGFSIDGPVAPNILAPYPGQNWDVSSPIFDGVIMKWTPQSGYDDSVYNLRIGLDEEFANVIYDITTELDLDTVNVLSTGYYYWDVRECNTVNICGDRSYAGYFNLVGPETPQHLAPENFATIYDTNTPTFEWSDMDYTTQYIVNIYNETNDIEEVSTDISLELQTPLDEGTYYWRVKSGSENNVFSNWSVQDTLTIDGPPPPAVLYPEDNETINMTNSPVLSWESSSYAIQYQILVSSVVNFSDTLVNVMTQDLEYQTDELPADTYYWKLRSQNEFGYWGSFSSQTSFKISGPSSPTGLMPANHSIVRDRVVIDFSWMKPDTLTVDYQFQISNDYNFINIHETHVVADTTVTVTLDKGEYYWRVSGRNIYDIWGSWSAEYDIEINGPDAPAMLTPAQNLIETGTNEILFSWNPTDAYSTSYDLMVSSNRFFTDIELDQTLSATEYTSSLPQGNHYWKIRGTNEHDVDGDWSEIWLVEVDGPLAPIIIAPEYETEIIDDNPELIWSSSENAVSYLFELSREEDFENIEISETISDTSMLVVGLDEGWWFWRTAAVNMNGLIGDYSESRFYMGINPVSTIGGFANDFFRSGFSSWDDGFIMIGETESFGSGGKDGMITKLYSNGAEAWTMPFGNSFENNIFDGILTDDGGMAFIGQSYNHDGSDVWIVKTNSAGQIEWEDTYGGLAYDKGNAILQNDDGTFTFAGGTYSSGSGLSDIYLVKLNQAGNISWSQTFGSVDIDWAHDLVHTYDGGYILLGFTKSEYASHTDVIVIRTNNLGEEIWRYVYDSGYTDFGYVIEPSGDGGYVICGFSENGDDDDLLLLKIDSAGNEEWAQHFGGNRNERGYGVAVDFTGNIYAVGSTDSYGIGSLKNGWVIQVSSSGMLEWDQTYGGYEDDEIYSIKMVPDGGFILNGYTKSYGMGAMDGWYFKLGNSYILEY